MSCTVATKDLISQKIYIGIPTGPTVVSQNTATGKPVTVAENMKLEVVQDRSMVAFLVSIQTFIFTAKRVHCMPIDRRTTVVRFVHSNGVFAEAVRPVPQRLCHPPLSLTYGLRRCRAHGLITTVIIFSKYLRYGSR